MRIPFRFINVFTIVSCPHQDMVSSMLIPFHVPFCHMRTFLCKTHVKTQKNVHGERMQEEVLSGSRLTIPRASLLMRTTPCTCIHCMYQNM